MPPIFPEEPTRVGDGDQDEPDHGELVDSGVTDIGIGAGGPAQPRATMQASNRAPMPRWVLGVVAGVVLVAALLIGVFAGDDTDRATEAPDSERPPVQTSPPEVLDTQPTPSPDLPAFVPLPIINQGWSRAGEECRVRLKDDWIDELVFTIPDGRSMLDCASSGPLLRTPGDDPRDRLGDVGVWGGAFEEWAANFPDFGDDIATTTQWAPVAGRRAYRIDLDTDDVDQVDRVHIIEVPGAVVVVNGRQRDFAPGITESIDDLVASIRIEGPQAEPPPLPQPGGWCAGDHFVTQVPHQWFAGDSCEWMSRVSRSPELLECNCLPPLWIEATTAPLDADFGFTRIDADRLVEHSDGWAVRRIEGQRLDRSGTERTHRAVVVDAGLERIAIYAADVDQHIVSGQTWQQTLDAQQVAFQLLRFHSNPECGTGERLIATGSGADETVSIQTGMFSPTFPSGAAVLATGCDRVANGVAQREVQLEAEPTIIGWVDAARLAPPEITLCPSGEGVFLPTDWNHATWGDFDGDGRIDTAYTKDGNLGTTDDYADRPNAAVLFANGGLVTAVVPGDGPPGVDRLLGMGRDVIVLGRPSPDDGSVLLDVQACSIETVFGWTSVQSPEYRSGVCRDRVDLTDSIRTWQESYDRHQGWVREFDAVFTAQGPLIDGSGDQWCGPFLTPQLPTIEAGGPGTGLAGQHSLMLQWITARRYGGPRPVDSAGEIAFVPLGDDRYEVTGSQQDDRGSKLVVVGTIERVSADELRFDGTITTTVAWLNGGEPCVRRAGQQFVRRSGLDVFRMQDRINCDGGRTDWIDIVLDAD